MLENPTFKSFLSFGLQIKASSLGPAGNVRFSGGHDATILWKLLSAKAAIDDGLNGNEVRVTSTAGLRWGCSA